MKSMKISTLATIALSAVLSTGLAAGAHASDWVIDPAHTASQFSVKHMMVSTVRGVFEKTTGTVMIDDKDPTKSKIDVTIDAASVNTREPKRDGHLKSPDFFDVANHPNITFKSTKIEKAGKDKFKVTGDLTIRGVTKSVVLDVDGPSAEIKNPWGGLVRGLTATCKINRHDFKLDWQKPLEKAGGMLVGDDVNIEIDAELNPKPPAAPAAPAPAPAPAPAAPPVKK